MEAITANTLDEALLLDKTRWSTNPRSGGQPHARRSTSTSRLRRLTSPCYGGHPSGASKLSFKSTANSIVEFEGQNLRRSLASMWDSTANPSPGHTATPCHVMAASPLIFEIDFTSKFGRSTPPCVHTVASKPMLDGRPLLSSSGRSTRQSYGQPPLGQAANSHARYGGHPPSIFEIELHVHTATPLQGDAAN